MMRLKTLILNNFRCFAGKEPTIIDLNHSVVLINGRNALGKTSIFDAIELLMTGAVKRLEGLKIPELLVNVGRHSESAELTLEVELNKPVSSSLQVDSNTDKLPYFRPILSTEEDRFRFDHTLYLPQFNMQRVIQSDEKTLGDIIRRLCINKDIDVLWSGLLDARIDRTHRAYRAVKQTLRDLELRKSQISEKRQQTSDLIRQLEPSLESLNRWHSQLEQIARDGERQLTVTAETRDLLYQSEDLLKHLQSSLAQMLRRRDKAINAAEECRELIAEQRQINSSKDELSNIQAQTKSLNARTALLIAEIEAAEKEIRELTSKEGPVSRTAKLLNILFQANEFAESVCPICDREFDDLRSHIAVKMTKLNGENSRLQSRISELQESIKAWANELQEHKMTIQVNERKIRDLERSQHLFDRRIADFHARYLKILDEGFTFETIAAFEHSENLKASSEINRMQILIEKVAILRSELDASTTRVSALRKEFAFLQADESKCANALSQAKIAGEQVDRFIDVAAELRQRLAVRVEAILKSFISERVHELFVDLFRRTTRNPFFDVRISQPIVRYNKPQLQIYATSNGIDLSPKGAFSQGDLNAAGLALFLALASAEQPHLGVILLDDPVQNMDEAHIEEFTQILKSIKDDLGWQIVVSVHESSIFQYLLRQLYPSREGQSLAAYALDRTEKDTVVNLVQSAVFQREDYLLPAGAA